MLYGEMKLDWLAFTFKPTSKTFSEYYNFDLDNKPENLLQAFYYVFPEIHKFIETTKEELLRYRPGNHYALSIDCCDYFYISFDLTSQALNKGVNVQVPAHGLWKIFELFNITEDDPKKNIKDIMQLLYSRCCTLSRIDLCFDDFTKTFRPRDYDNWFNNGLISCNFKCESFHQNSFGAQTVYFGKERSDKFLRIYDKFMVSDIDSVRYEFELHGRPCKELGLFLLENDFDFGKYLLSWFKVLDPDKMYSGTNKANSPLLPEWQQWLELEFSEVPTPIKVPHSPHIDDIKNKIKWVDTCKWALMTAMCCNGHDKLTVMNILNINEEMLHDIPLKYKRVLLDHNIIGIDN